MTPFLLTLAVFAVFWLVGLALFSIVRADTSALRVTLTAPALGSVALLIPAFLLSEAGFAIEGVATPLVTVVVLVAICIVAYSRPRVPVTVLPVIAICLCGLLIAAQPMFEFGFHWIANANDDMGNYTLSAQQLIHHGLLSHFDTSGIQHGTDYATVLTGLHLEGARPGTDLMLAVLSAITGHLPYEAFMPLIFAFSLCGLCGAGALAMQATNRWWAATVAATLLAVSPLATFGVLQQLFAQAWGLALGTSLFALLMNRQLYRERVRLADAIPIAILATGLVLAYVELASVLAVAYVLYLLLLGARRELSARAVAGLLVVIAVVAIVTVNVYLFKELHFVSGQASAGSGGVGVPLFGFSLVPSALPGLLGIQELRPLIEAPHLQLSIAVAAALLCGVLVGCLASARQGVGAAVALLTMLAVGVVLAINNSDFGLYKLFMYVQPFLAAAVAVWIATTRRWLSWSIAAAVILVVVTQLPTQSSYVKRSREPVELPHASAGDVLPAFRTAAFTARGPIVGESENPTLIKLEAQIARGRPTFFLGTNVFYRAVRALPKEAFAKASEARALRGYATHRHFNLLTARDKSPDTDGFLEMMGVSAALANPSCRLALPSGSEIVINRRSLPEGLPGIVDPPCDQARNLLAFVSSELGESYYLPAHRPRVSFYQLEQDYFFPGHSLSGFGRYVLFRVLGPTHGARLELDLTTSLRHDGSNQLPPATVVGATRVALPLVGRGSAHVFSAPLRYQTVAGVPYLLLDLGVNGQLARYVRSGLAGLYGRSVVLDPRFLTSYVRNISLVSETEYSHLRPPAALQRFPEDLADPDLEYSGIYEDGWVGEDSYAVLAGGPAADLRIRASVPVHAGKHLEVIVDKRVVASVPVAPGTLDLRVPLPASNMRRRVELRFAATVHLKAPDLRPVSALLSFLGLVPPAHGS